MKKRISLLLVLIIALMSVMTSCFTPTPPEEGSFSLDDIPEFSGKAYISINNNIPSFTDEEKSKTKSYEFYSELDELGRCGYTMACIGRDLMPTEDRGSIGQVKPSGWQTVKYDIVDGKYLYNRCHLIGFQLTGENANEKNLITGTRYLNIEGMLPFENMIADYIKETNNHVLYRVTPIYDGYNLVASGVHMEGYSIEDEGDGICFNVYAYNNQPGVVINYSNGMSRLATAEEWNGKEEEPVSPPTVTDTYKLNTKTKKIHMPDCTHAKDLTETCTGDEIAALKGEGYVPCGGCDPFIEEVWEAICGHRDIDDNNLCDNCNAAFDDGCDKHIDANDNGKCDVCAKDFTDKCDIHRDADDDGICDSEGCGEAFDDGAEIRKYVINTNTNKIHLFGHKHLDALSNPDGEQYILFEGTEEELLAAYPESEGYSACGTCKPFN